MTFLFVFIGLRYDDEENKNFEGILVSEVRGKFGKKKWPKAETKGKLCTFLSSLNLVVSGCCRQMKSSNIIQNTEKALNNAHTKNQEQTNNGFSNTKEHSKFLFY